jgi:hypothetical protein
MHVRRGTSVTRRRGSAAISSSLAKAVIGGIDASMVAAAAPSNAWRRVNISVLLRLFL